MSRRAAEPVGAASSAGAARPVRAARRVGAALGALAALLVIAGCGSPEAERVRGGGPGADPGNRDGVVRMHAGADQYAGTPCMTGLPECTGPLPVSGRSTDERGERR